MTIQQMLDIYEISKANFEANGWGNAINKIKYPASYVKRWEDSSGVFDEAHAFEELAITSIMKFRDAFPILREIGPYWRFAPDADKEKLRGGVFKLIQSTILNRNIWERKDTSQISIPGWSQNVDATGWIIPMDAIDFDTEQMGIEAGLYDLELIDDKTDDKYKVLFTITDTDNVSKARMKEICIMNGVDTATAEKIADQIKKEGI